MRHEISRLTDRLQKLALENDDLRKICKVNGILHLDEKLAAIRHRRYFTYLYAENAIEGAVTVSDTICVPPILHRVAEFSRPLLNFALASRCIFAESKRLTELF